MATEDSVPCVVYQVLGAPGSGKSTALPLFFDAVVNLDTRKPAYGFDADKAAAALWTAGLADAKAAPSALRADVWSDVLYTNIRSLVRLGFQIIVIGGGPPLQTGGPIQGVALQVHHIVLVRDLPWFETVLRKRRDAAPDGSFWALFSDEEISAAARKSHEKTEALRLLPEALISPSEATAPNGPSDSSGEQNNSADLVHQP